MNKIGKPVIFNFQPTSYKTLTTPDELKQWEKDMKDYVGIKVDYGNMTATCTECTSGGTKDDCDSD